MKGLDQYWVPYLISQVVSLIFLGMAWKSVRWGRILFSLLFLWAAGTNLYTGLTDPDSYLANATLAIPLYSRFINGWFSHHHHLIIPLIAVAQLLIGLGMLLKGWWVKTACIGAIVFLLSIAPLMVGSAFPFSITVSIAAWLIYRAPEHPWLWKHKLQAV